MKWFVTSVWPVVWCLETAVSRVMALGERRFQGSIPGPDKAEDFHLQELRASAAIARTSRLIGPQEEMIIHGATGLPARTLREIMLPANAISMLDADGAIADALIAAHLEMHTRFPVAERSGDPQSIIGYVNFKDIVAHMRLAPHGSSLRKIVRAIPCFAADTPVSDCLARLIREHVHIAIVRDGNARVVGMVTLEDMLEELVGDIQDEYDQLPTHIVACGRGWVVGGGISPANLLDATGIPIGSESAEPIPSLSDWITRMSTNPIRGGDVINNGRVRVAIRKVRRQKVLEVQIEKLPE
jgi:putative hemolysin